MFFRYDPRELDVVLREVVIMNSRAEMYLKFIEKRISVRTFYVEYFHRSSLAHYPSCRTTSLLPLLISLCKGKRSFKPYQNEHQGKRIRISCCWVYDSFLELVLMTIEIKECLGDISLEIIFVLYF